MLSFDPSSIMAPHGVVSGLEDLGSAVVNALNRRSERRYATNKEQRARGYQLEDQASEEARRSREYVRALEDKRADVQTGYGHEDTIAARAQRVAAARGATPEDPYGFTQALRDQGDVSPDEITNLEGIEGGAAADRGIKAKSKTATNAKKPYIKPSKPLMKKDIVGRSIPDYAGTANLRRTEAAAARAAGAEEQAMELDADADRNEAAENLGPEPKVDEAGELERGATIQDFGNSAEYKNLGAPAQAPGQNLSDLWQVKNGQPTFTQRNQSLFSSDSPDQNFFEDSGTGPQHSAELANAFQQYRVRKQAAIHAATEAKKAEHRAKISAALSTANPSISPVTGQTTDAAITPAATTVSADPVAAAIRAKLKLRGHNIPEGAEYDAALIQKYRGPEGVP